MYIRIYIHTVSSLDLEKVALLCVFDQAHVETSARRQVSADVIKPSAGQYIYAQLSHKRIAYCSIVCTNNVFHIYAYILHVYVHS